MGKKKHKHIKQAGWGEPGYGATAGMGGMGADPYGAAGLGAMNGMGTMPGMNTAPGMNNSFLHGLQGLVGSRHAEQFILGALLGAAAVYVLGDEEMRAKLVKTAMKLYSGVAGGFEEIKEQMADIKAEVAAEQRSK
jgi:hypothetical protein